MSHCERFAQIAQDKRATMSKLLRSFRGNEQRWANRSGRSRQMSDSERFAQVAHDKWANERFTQIFLAKTSKILFFSTFYIGIFLFKNEGFAHSLIFGERCERIAKVAHQNEWWERSLRCCLPIMSATMSDSLRSLTKNERSWANCSGRSLKMSEWANCWVFFEQIAHLLIFSQKMSNSLRNPMSKFPALHFSWRDLLIVF